MDQYLVLKNIEVINANAISGFTYGFPAVTHFLGYVHALSRKLNKDEDNPIELSSVGVICHKQHVYAHRESIYEPFAFSLTRNPVTKEGKTAPINEEGRMSMTVSLIIRAKGIPYNVEKVKQDTCQRIKNLAERQKLAGGQIVSIGACFLKNNKTSDKALLRSLLPGFILKDRSDLLPETCDAPENQINNWLDFSSLKFSANSEPNESDEYEWTMSNKHAGYLVPIQIGYKAISDTYKPGEVAGSRDPATPLTFVEAVHSVGEWIGSPSRIDSLNEILWNYSFEAPFYVAHCNSKKSEKLFNHSNNQLDF